MTRDAREDASSSAESRAGPEISVEKTHSRFNLDRPAPEQRVSYLIQTFPEQSALFNGFDGELTSDRGALLELEPVESFADRYWGAEGTSGTRRWCIQRAKNQRGERE